MHYKTIVLELIRQQTDLHDMLRRKRRLLAAVNRHARELKTRHKDLVTTLTTNRAGIDPGQVSSAALEIAVKEVESRLRLASPADNQQASNPTLHA